MQQASGQNTRTRGVKKIDQSTFRSVTGSGAIARAMIFNGQRK